MPPDNGTYMVVGYIAVGVIYGAYAISLFLRARAEKRKG
jgi:ABC-type arginine transport system permease subunit